jgi:hypothetical protein
MNTTSNATLESALAAYAAGSSLKMAGALMDYCPEGFRKVLKRHGIPVRDRVSGARRKYTLQHDYFASIDTHEKAWLLGFAATDGLIREEGNWCLTFGLAPKDKEILFRIREVIGSDAPITDKLVTSSNGQQYPACFVSFHSERLVRDLIALGITAAKSHRVKPPVIPAELEQSFWLGAMDGDGGLSQWKGCVGHGIHFCGNFHMVSAFADFVHRAAGVQRKPKPCTSIFQVQYNRREHVVAILSLLYRDSPISLERKHLIAQAELARKVVSYKFTDLAAEELLRLKAEHGTWLKVADAIGASRTNMWNLRRRKGLL